MYLSSFRFPGIIREEDYMFFKFRDTVHSSFYPFQVFWDNKLEALEFEPITILYGGNGSGKTTALNIIAEKLGIHRESLYNRTDAFDDYLEMCNYELDQSIDKVSAIITSDDVFDFMLNLRAMNQGIDSKRGELFEEYTQAKYSKFQMKSLADYDQLVKVNDSRRKSRAKYTNARLMHNVREFSNGESAFIYFTQRISDNGLYLLDEPENSLSPERQLELVKYLENQARFFGCQLIIATHSPFILSMKNARIYDLSEEPVDIKKWTELENVRIYHDFFKKHEGEF